MNREFTGRNMATVMVLGFGVVMAVNFFMAGLAISGFGGVTVQNSYVASQKFNGWLEEAERSRALGWDVDVARDGTGHLVLATTGVPEDAIITANLRRPLGTKETASLAFTKGADGNYRSTQPVSAGRWTMRLAIVAGEENWAEEVPLT